MSEIDIKKEINSDLEELEEPDFDFEFCYYSGSEDEEESREPTPQLMSITDHLDSILNEIQNPQLKIEPTDDTFDTSNSDLSIVENEQSKFEPRPPSPIRTRSRQKNRSLAEEASQLNLSGEEALSQQRDSTENLLIQAKETLKPVEGSKNLFKDNAGQIYRKRNVSGRVIYLKCAGESCNVSAVYHLDKKTLRLKGRHMGHGPNKNDAQLIEMRSLCRKKATDPSLFDRSTLDLYKQCIRQCKKLYVPADYKSKTLAYMRRLRKQIRKEENGEIIIKQEENDENSEHECEQSEREEETKKKIFIPVKTLGFELVKGSTNTFKDNAGNIYKKIVSYSNRMYLRCHVKHCDVKLTYNLDDQTVRVRNEHTNHKTGPQVAQFAQNLVNNPHRGCIPERIFIPVETLGLELLKGSTNTFKDNAGNIYKKIVSHPNRMYLRCHVKNCDVRLTYNLDDQTVRAINEHTNHETGPKVAQLLEFNNAHPSSIQERIFVPVETLGLELVKGSTNTFKDKAENIYKKSVSYSNRMYLRCHVKHCNVRLTYNMDDQTVRVINKHANHETGPEVAQLLELNNLLRRQAVDPKFQQQKCSVIYRNCMEQHCHIDVPLLHRRRILHKMRILRRAANLNCKRKKMIKLNEKKSKQKLKKTPNTVQTVGEKPKSALVNVGMKNDSKKEKKGPRAPKRTNKLPKIKKEIIEMKEESKSMYPREIKTEPDASFDWCIAENLNVLNVKQLDGIL